MITVFGFPTSPFVRKVLLIAAEKQLAVELVPATPHKPTPEFLAASPFGMMPALCDGDFMLADSSAIAFYLDAITPQPPILPDSAQARGRAVWFDEFAETVLAAPARGMAFNRWIGPNLLGLPANEAAAMAAQTGAAPALDYLEGEMPDCGWLTGEAFCLADMAVASCLATMAYGYDVDQRPRTAAWRARVAARPSWRQVAAREQAMVAEAIASGAHRPG